MAGLGMISPELSNLGCELWVETGSRCNQTQQDDREGLDGDHEAHSELGTLALTQAEAAEGQAA